MIKFLAGFLAASALWGAVFAYIHFGWPGAETTAAAAPAPVDGSQPVARAAPRTKRRKGAASPASTRPPGAQGDDALGWDEPQNLDLAGPEGQLSGAQIEAGFDAIMPRVRRCLVLAPAEAELTGRLLFGMRVGSDGAVKAVALTGPSAVIGGECGDCLREVARGATFARYDGPDTLFKFPIDLH